MEPNLGYHITPFLEHFAATSTTSREQISEIKLHFSYESKFSFYVFDKEYSDEPELVGSRVSEPRIDNIVILNPDELSDSEKAREIIGDKLGGSLDMAEAADLRRRWVSSALRKAREVVESMPAGHNVAVIKFPAVFNVDVIFSDAASFVYD